MSEATVEDLMSAAQKQLEEHSAWLAAEIKKINSTTTTSDAAIAFLAHQAGQIKLRMVRAGKEHVSVVWDYPDELVAYLRNPGTPQHLRDTLAGGHFVSTETPASFAKRLV